MNDAMIVGSVKISPKTVCKFRPCQLHFTDNEKNKSYNFALIDFISNANSLQSVCNLAAWIPKSLIFDKHFATNCFFMFSILPHHRVPKIIHDSNELIHFIIGRLYNGVKSD